MLGTMTFDLSAKADQHQDEPAGDADWITLYPCK